MNRIVESRFESSKRKLYCASVQPGAKAWARMAICHGYGDHIGRYAHFMEWLAEQGVAAFGFDFRGQGRSEGRRAYVQHWTDYLDDLRAFLALPALVDSDPPLFLLGHSHGGLVVAAAGIEGLPERVRGVVLTSPYLRNRVKIGMGKRLIACIGDHIAPGLLVSSGLTSEMMTHDLEMQAASDADPLIAHKGTPRWFSGAIAAQKRVMQEAERFTKPLLCLAGSDDGIADVETMQQFVETAGSKDRTFHVFEGMRHEVLREVRRIEVFSRILGWLKERT